MARIYIETDNGFKYNKEWNLISNKDGNTIIDLHATSIDKIMESLSEDDQIRMVLAFGRAYKEGRTDQKQKYENRIRKIFKLEEED